MKDKGYSYFFVAEKVFTVILPFVSARFNLFRI